MQQGRKMWRTHIRSIILYIRVSKPYLANLLVLFIWSYNSVGSECNPYKVEVVGSSPTGTTQCLSESWAETMQPGLNCSFWLGGDWKISCNLNILWRGGRSGDCGGLKIRRSGIVTHPLHTNPIIYVIELRNTYYIEYRRGLSGVTRNF